MRINMMMTNIKLNTGVFRMRQFLAIVNDLHFQSIILSKHFDLYPKNDNEYLLPILIKCTVGI